MFQKTLKDSVEPREELKSHLAFDLRPTRSRYWPTNGHVVPTN